MAAATMRAARLYGPGLPLRLEAAPLPRPDPGECLVRVRATGVCHTELHMLDGTLNLGVVPLIPGHEVVGEIVEAPPGARSLPGERVLLYYYAPCGKCRWCRAGQENLCPNVARQFGFTADGGYAEYLVAPAGSLLPIPDGLSDAAAAGLACGGATALHAVRAVARVQPGETAVVYGVGGVGFYLVQLLRLAGANVIAVGRTAEKLALAQELGAEHVVNARDSDPLEAVQALTGGDGAEVVFDLVASAETMALAPRMLARRGRLVFAGYGGAPFSVSPLWLVLREIAVLGAVGNTLAELRETVDLAARGALRSIVGASYPLEQVNDALAALQAGTLIGRAVIVPDLAAAQVDGAAQPGAGTPTPASGDAAGGGVVAGTGDAAERRDDAPKIDDDTVGAAPRGRPAPLPNDGSVVPTPTGRTLRSRGGAPTEDATRPADPQTPAATAPPTEPSEAPPAAPSSASAAEPEAATVAAEERPFERELLAVIAAGVDGPLARDDAAFNALALGLFRFQFARNTPYRRYCAYRGRTPERVEHWTEIPPVPIGAFKEATLVTEPPERAVAVFMSSGTTRPEQRSRHYHPDLSVYDASARTNFAAHLLPDDARLPLLILNPPRAALPNSSLAHYLSLMVEAYGAEGSGYFVDERGLDHAALQQALEAAVAAGRPVGLLGTTFAFVHLLDRFAAEGVRLALPPGSRVMDTGGVKGRSRAIGRDELEAALTERLGVPPDSQVNMYGLTELSTQYLDETLRDAMAGRSMGRYKTVPAWGRTRVLDPETLTELPAGSVGVLCHTDLANRASVCTILTEDLGTALEGGFEILGRVKGSEARGCSIAMDELLAATEGRR